MTLSGATHKYLTRRTKTCERCGSTCAPQSNAQRYCLNCGDKVRLEKARKANHKYMTPARRSRKNRRERDRRAQTLQFLTDKRAQQRCIADPQQIKTVAGADRIVCLGTKDSPCWFVGKALDHHVQQHFPNSPAPVAAFRKEWRLPKGFSLHSKAFSEKQSEHTRGRLKKPEYRQHLKKTTKDSWKIPRVAKARSRGIRDHWDAHSPEQRTKRLEGIRQSNKDYALWRKHHNREPGRPPGSLDEATLGRLRLVAAIRRAGKALAKYARYVFPDTPRSAEGNAYTLASRYKLEINELLQSLTDEEVRTLLQNCHD